MGVGLYHTKIGRACFIVNLRLNNVGSHWSTLHEIIKQTKRGINEQRGEKKGEVNCIRDKQGGTRGRKVRRGKQRKNYKKYEDCAHFVTAAPFLEVYLRP